MDPLILLPLTQKINFQASKWLKLQALLETEELKHLLQGIEASLFQMEGEVSLEEALLRYGRYIEALKNGKEPEPDPFGWNWTLDLSALYWLDTGSARQVRLRKPVVQISFHQMDYTPDDNTFRSNLYGPNMISWGLQFAFPQLYQDPETQEVLQVKDPERFPNVKLFRYLQKWLREQTVPTPFEQVNAPQRIGKKVLPWINRHPHLMSKGIKVKGALKAND